MRRNPGQPLIVFLHGIANSGKVWEPVIKKLPANVQYLSVDLLGFGYSKKPTYIDYDLSMHARSVIKTIKEQHFHASQIVLVGHSLGSLISIEVAKNDPKKINDIILCSPPFYVQSPDRRMPSQDDILKNLFNYARNNPENFVELTALAKKYKVVTKNFELNKKNSLPYMETLKSSIINQDSLRDAIWLPKHIKVYIIRGLLDPLILQKNLKVLKKSRPGTVITTITAAHDLNSRYYKEVSLELSTILANYDTSTIPKR